jgi:nucleoside-diphosphate-sugar epimerase
MSHGMCKSANASPPTSAVLTVAITGANGFVGRRLVGQHLARGDRVRVLTRRGFSPPECSRGVEQFLGDLAMGPLPAAFLDQADVVYHCAAELNDPAKMELVNALGTARLLEMAQGRVGRWVQLSSAGVYGMNAIGRVTEATLPAPRNPYERSKKAADEAVMAAGQEGLEYAILRPTNVFGPDMTNRSLRQWAMMVRSGLYIHIGPTGASANYIHVDNVVHAMRLCGTHRNAAGGLFNLSDYRTMEEFIGAMASALQLAAPARRLPIGIARLAASAVGWIPGSPLTSSRLGVLTDRATYPIDLIETRLGYTHAISMEDGLTATIRSFFPAR